MRGLGGWSVGVAGGRPGVVLLTSRLEAPPDTRTRAQFAPGLDSARGTPGLEGLEPARLVHNTRSAALSRMRTFRRMASVSAN